MYNVKDPQEKDIKKRAFKKINIGKLRTYRSENISHVILGQN